MTFRIGGVLVAAFAISLLCTLGTSAKADGGAGDGKDQSASANRNHRAHAKPQLQKESAGLPGTGPQSAPPNRLIARSFGSPLGGERRLCRIHGTRIKGILPTPLIIPARSAVLVGRR